MKPVIVRHRYGFAANRAVVVQGRIDAVVERQIVEHLGVTQVTEDTKDRY
ncbi:MAG: hypothetical protein K9N51_09100 [Candidatus Pacebacteria bacterium]|nr:hypothetical protein [Candidatus Paceibacterota bacterium]